MDIANKRALIVEDNADLARLVQLHLQDLHMQTDVASDGLAAMNLFNVYTYDVLVLDIMLPEIDGLEVCKRVRAKNRQIPILMLTAKSEEIDKVLGLELGADDYLTKPFGVAEFTARIKALLRRAEQSSGDAKTSMPEKISHGGILIDTEKRLVKLDGKVVDLTVREFELLSHFARHPGLVFTREDLLKQVWGYANGVYQHTVNSHINRLRTKIETDPANPEYVVTVWGVGYKFAELDDA
ncbi:MAG: response regulator transcription factor [Arenicellales bacterium WSBS_2016_MAG_OTU3]